MALIINEGYQYTNYVYVSNIVTSNIIVFIKGHFNRFGVKNYNGKIRSINTQF